MIYGCLIGGALTALIALIATHNILAGIGLAGIGLAIVLAIFHQGNSN